jgi:hypothetical protein
MLSIPFNKILKGIADEKEKLIKSFWINYGSMILTSVDLMKKKS